MFNSIGIGEIIVIAVIALIVMGPEKFPEFAKIAMRAFRDVRGYVDDIKKEMANELNPVKREINQLARHNPEEYIDKIAGAVTAAVEEEPETKTAEPDSKAVDASPAENSKEDSPDPEPYRYED